MEFSVQKLFLKLRFFFWIIIGVPGHKVFAEDFFLCVLKENFGLFVSFQGGFDENGLLGHRLIDSRWFEKNPRTEIG